MDSEPPLAEAAVELFAERGHPVSAEEFKPFVGMGEDRYIGGVAESRGIVLDPVQDKARLYEIYLRLIRGRLRPLPGAVEFVNECRDRGLAVAVASGADRIKVLANLGEIGLPQAVFAAVVDGNHVVHKKPAPDIFLEACRRIRTERYPGGLPAGHAVATTGGNLKARWVIHTVGPIYSRSADPAGELASCHTESLRVADELGAATVAFPAISTGAFGYPLEEAAPVAIRAIRQAHTRVREVRFVLFDERTRSAFERALATVEA